MARCGSAEKRRESAIRDRVLVGLALVGSGLGCESTSARLDLLEKMHADDGTHIDRIPVESTLTRWVDATLGVVNLAPHREPTYETLKNPAARCQEELLGIGGRRFDSPIQMGFAVALLSSIAARDRSHVSRAHSLFDLCQICVDWIAPATRRAPYDNADIEAGEAAARSLISMHGDAGRHRADLADAPAKCLAAMRTAARSRYDNARSARAVLRLFATLHRFETDHLIRAAIEEGIPPLSAQVAVLTHLEALADDRAYVRHDAAEGLGLIGSKDTGPPLAAVLARETDSQVRWAILRALARLKDARTLPMVLKAASHNDPTARACAIQALSAITGKSIGNDLDGWRRVVEEGSAPQPSPGEPTR